MVPLGGALRRLRPSVRPFSNWCDDVSANALGVSSG